VSKKFYFEDFEVDTQKKKVFCPDGEINLRPKALELLFFFLENRNRIISRDELLKKVWTNQHVVPQVVNQTVLELRKVFSHSNSGRNIIKTHSGKGYQWNTTVTVFAGDSSVKNQEGTTLSGKERRRKSVRILAFAVVLSLSLILLFMVNHTVSPDNNLQTGKMKLIVLPFVNETGSPDQDYLELGLHDMVVHNLGQQFTVFPVNEVLNLLKLRPSFNRANPTRSDLRFLRKAMAFDGLVATRIGMEKEKYLFNFSIYSSEKPMGSVKVKLRNPLKLWKPIAGGLSSYLNTSLNLNAIEPNHLGIKSNQLFWKGRQFQLQGEYRKALPYFRVCLSEAPQFTKAALHLTNALILLGSYDEAKKELDRIFSRLNKLAPQDRAETHYLFGKYYANTFEPEPAQKHTLKALTYLEKVNRSMEAAMCLNLLGSIYFDQGNYAKSLEAYRLAESSLQKNGDFYAIPFVYLNLGEVLSIQGKWEEARILWEKANDTFNAFGVRRGVAKSLLFLGEYDSWNEELDQAEAHFMEAKAIFEELGEKQRMVAASSELSLLAYRRGDLKKCLALRLKELEDYTELGSTLNISIALNNLGTVYIAMGKWNEAERYLNRCFALSNKIKDTEGQLFACFGLIELNYHRDNLPAMKTYLQNARDRVQNQDFLFPAVLCYEALTAFKAGQFEQALDFQKRAESLEKEWNKTRKEYLMIYEKQLKSPTRRLHLPLEQDPKYGPLGI
jgi:DNA-binding winged helix-turn-helix (wHTH) protein/tetratricopeptide (TPR) repeat protein